MPPTLHEAGTRLAVRFLKNIRRRGHPHSASDSTSRTRSACRETPCFWDI